MRTTALSVTIAGLVGTSAIHLWQYLDGYSAAPNGWMFLVQAVAAAVLVGLVVVGRDGIAAPAVVSALQLASLLALTLAYTSGFLGFVERGLRPATAITIVSGVVGLAGAVWLLVGNLRPSGDGVSTPELLAG